MVIKLKQRMVMPHMMFCRIILILSLTATCAALQWDKGSEKTTPPFGNLNDNGQWGMDMDDVDDEKFKQEDRILHCPPDSAGNKETQHDELAHAYINYVTKTILFGLLIVIGLLSNISILAVIQYFQVSPMRAAMSAEIVAIIAYLIFLIPLYPVANFHPYTGQFELYEVAKPYVTPFFTTCNEICELLMIWIFLWLNRIRHILVAKWDKPRAEKCTTKAVRDELRLLTALAVIVSLPKFFDSEMKVRADPCNPGQILVQSEPNGLGENVIYELVYKVGAMTLLYYIIPFIWLAKLTYKTHHVLRRSERPAGDTKQDIMRERVKTRDGITTELDKRILLFYILLVPGALYSITKKALYTVPDIKQIYLELVETVHVVAIAFSLTYAALSPIVVYATILEPFRAKVKEKYWNRVLEVRQRIKKRKKLESAYRVVKERLKQQERNSNTLTIKLDSEERSRMTVESKL